MFSSNFHSVNLYLLRFGGESLLPILTCLFHADMIYSVVKPNHRSLGVEIKYSIVNIFHYSELKKSYDMEDIDCIGQNS